MQRRGDTCSGPPPSASVSAAVGWERQEDEYVGQRRTRRLRGRPWEALRLHNPKFLPPEDAASEKVRAGLGDAVWEGGSMGALEVILGLRVMHGTPQGGRGSKFLQDEQCSRGRQVTDKMRGRSEGHGGTAKHMATYALRAQ